MDEEQVRGALDLLAFRVHRDTGAATGQAANVPESSLSQALIDTREKYGNKAAMVPEEIRDYLNQRCGIMIAENPSLYRFPHRFFQEYLAASILEENAQKRKACFAEDPMLWRESILFLVVRLTKGDRIWTLIREHRLWENEEKDH